MILITSSIMDGAVMDLKHHFYDGTSILVLDREVSLVWEQNGLLGPLIYFLEAYSSLSLFNLV